jgi:signal transduction histidine kinase
MPVTWYDPRELRSVQVVEGNRVAIDTTMFPICDREGRVTHVAFLFKDVTREETSREEMQRERDLLSAIVEQSADGIVVVDEKGLVRLVNAEAQRQGASGPPEPLQSPFRVVLGPDGEPLPQESLPVSRALRGESASATVHVRLPEGLRRLNARASPLRGPDGSVRGAVVTTRDETARIAREEESARTARFREQFIGVLGHDLRSPLTAIIAGAGLVLRHENLPPAVSTAATHIASAADRMRRMIGDLLDFTQARLGGGIPLERREVDLAPIVGQMVDEVALGHPGRSMLLKVTGDLRGWFDVDRIAQLVGNLLENALNYGPPDAPVIVEAVGADRVRIAVANQGPPLSPEDQQRVFLPFERGSQAGRRGLGLGLFIVDQIARAHGGTIELRSDPSETRFTALLPRQR